MSTTRYTVKQVAGITGVPTATLRAWERRYSVVEPQRSDSRYRLYDQDEVDRLSRMAELVRAGTPARLAAAQVSPPQSQVTAPPVAVLTEVAHTYDQQRLDEALDAAMASGEFEHVLEDWLRPALEELGDAWADGQVDVSGEHFVSAAVHRRLATAFEAATPPAHSPVVLVGLPPHALHDLGAMAFAVCLRRRGLDVRYLGADLPEESWRHSVRALRPAGVVVSVPLDRDATSAEQLAALLAEADPTVPVWVGGRGAAAVRAGQPLPQAAAEAARTVADVLAATV